MTTYQAVRRIALAFPFVEEGLSYGTPALKVKGKLFVRLRDDIDSIVVRTSFERRDELLTADPQAYYITDHYLRYGWMLVRLAAVRPKAMAELLHEAYDETLRPKRARRS